jgi:hypothetical protein
MNEWTMHRQMARNLPADRMRDEHMLHHSQSVPMLDERSALWRDMPQRNDEEGGNQPRLSFSLAASAWGQMGHANLEKDRTTLISVTCGVRRIAFVCRPFARPIEWTTENRSKSRTTETITAEDYVFFFHQYFRFYKQPRLRPFCLRYQAGRNEPTITRDHHARRPRPWQRDTVTL